LYPPIYEIIEITTSEFPLEGSSNPLPMVPEVEEVLSDCGEIGEVVGGEGLALDDRKLATFRCKIASSGPDYKWGPIPKFRHIEPNPTSLIDFFVETHCVCRYNSVRA
jgi:hypothetical protein